MTQNDHPFKYDPSMTAAFKSLGDVPATMSEGKQVKTVVLGGGTGANVSIRTLLSMGLSVSAVVAMADDGGSTGIIREEAHVTPPGDVRKCIGAMAADQDDPLTHAFKYRFEFARNHTLGNLMLSALEDATGSFPEAIAICENLLHSRGHVYPSTLDNINLSALDIDGEELDGQSKASNSSKPLKNVWLTSPGVCHPYGKALEVIRDADIIIVGPGSLFTSIIPNLLVPGVTQAIEDSSAKTVFVCSVADLQGETSGLGCRDLVKALLDHGMLGLLDYVILHSAEPLMHYGEERAQLAKLPEGSTRPVGISLEEVEWIEDTGATVFVRNLFNPKNPAWHNPYELRLVFTEIMKRCLSQPR